MTNEPTRPCTPDPVACPPGPSTRSHLPPETVDCTVDHPNPITVTAEARSASSSDMGIPGYEVLGELGRGGMGVVFRARNIRLNREVALKLMLGGSADRRELTRFLAEAEAVAAVRHPNVIQIYESGEVDGKPYMVLELLPGGTLAERLQPLIGRPPAEAAEVIAKVARGVAAAHELGIVHRDLKPGNVLFDEHGEPKVTDFGLAKVASATDLTRTGAIFGTPAYMAPEQASGNAKFVGPQADVWALGVMLHEALAGRRPFHHSNISLLLAMIRDDEPQLLRSQNPAVPRDLDVICRKCLEKEPADRYPTAQELADDLARFVAGEPITARPAGFVERTVKWIRRKPALAGLYGATMVAALSMGVGLLLWQSEATARQEKRNADEARAAAEHAKTDAEHAASLAREAETNEKAARAKAEAGEQRVAALRDDLARLEYARSIDLAHREFQVNDIARARVLLQNCREEFRGWEWHHVHRLCHADSYTIPDCKHLCAVSPDGKRGVDWFEGQLCLRELSTGTKIWTADQHFSAEPRIAFHPDGNEMAVYDQFGGKVVIWDTKAGKPLRELGFHDEKLQRSAGTITYNRTGTLLLTTNDASTTAKVWDATTGKARFVTPAQKVWLGAAFSPDDKRILVVDYDGNAGVWDLDKGERVLDLKGHTRWLRVACFTPDGSKMVTGGGDGVRVWDAKNGTPLKAYAADVGGVYSFMVDPTGQQLLTGCWDRTVRLWDLANGTPIRTLRGHTNWVPRVAFTDNGAGVVSCGNGEATRMWRLQDEPAGIVGHRDWKQGGPNSVGISLDGKRLVAGGDAPFGVWDTRTGRSIPQKLSGTSPLATTFVSHDGEQAAVFQGVSAGVVGRVWKLNPLSNVAGLEAGDFRGYTPMVMSFSPDGKLFLGSNQNRIFVWDTLTGKLLTTYTGHRLQVTRLAVGPAGQVISGSDESSFRIWEARTGKEIHTRLPQDRRGYSAFSWDGSRIVTSALEEGMLVVCDAATLAPILKIPGLTSVLAFSPDGTRIVAGQMGGDVKLFDARSGAELLTLRGHTAYVSDVAFSSDGQRLVTTAADGTARTWETAPLNRAFLKSPSKKP